MSPQDLEFLCALVRARSGLVLTGERGFFAETRLSPVARKEGAPSVTDLVQRVKESGDDRLMRAVVEAMLIQETSFFRDRAVFSGIGEVVLPALAAAKSGPVRVWSAGCAFGQEPYSLAMLAAESSSRLGLDIFASDLGSAGLEKAESGLYTHFEVQRGLPIRRLLEHFEPVDDAWRIAPALRQMVRWRRLNLVDEFKVATPFDLILCRNVIDGFYPPIRATVIERLTRALAPGGWLVLGPNDAAPAEFSPTGIRGIFRRKLALVAAA